MRILLIWEIVPESTDLVLIEDPTEEQLRMLELANNTFLNSDDENEGLLYLNAALGDPEDCEGEEHAGIWADCKEESPVDGPIDRVFLSGFVL